MKPGRNRTKHLAMILAIVIAVVFVAFFGINTFAAPKAVAHIKTINEKLTKVPNFFISYILLWE